MPSLRRALLPPRCLLTPFLPPTTAHSTQHNPPLLSRRDLSLCALPYAQHTALSRDLLNEQWNPSFQFSPTSTNALFQATRSIHLCARLARAFPCPARAVHELLGCSFLRAAHISLTRFSSSSFNFIFLVKPSSASDQLNSTGSLPSLNSITRIGRFSKPSGSYRSQVTIHNLYFL